MDIKVSFDEAAVNKEFNTRLQEVYKSRMISAIEKHFNSTSVGSYDRATGKHTVQTIEGDGFKEIEATLAKKFCDPVFQEKINVYFEENWQRIFQECMTKALTHKANAVVFNKS